MRARRRARTTTAPALAKRDAFLNRGCRSREGRGVDQHHRDEEVAAWFSLFDDCARRQESPADFNTPRADADSFPSDAPANTRNTIDGAVEVVRHQQRPVFHGKQIHRPRDVIVVLEEAGDEGLDRPHGAIAVQLDDYNVAAELDGAVPRAVARKEDGVAVCGAESIARVELQAKRGGMGSEQGDRLGELAARVPPA